MIQPILPIAGVPDELLRVVNDRLRELDSRAGTGDGTPGPPGPPGPAGLPGDDGEDGTSGTGTAPPSVLSTSTAAVYYERSSHQQLFGFQGRIDLPTTDPAFAAHFKRLDVIAIGPDKAGHIIATFKGAALTNPINYQGTAGVRPINPDADEVWSVAFQPFSEAGVPSAAPFTVSSLTVYAAKVGTLAAMPVPGTYYQDKDQGLHFEVQIDVTLLHQDSESELSIWLDFDKGEGWVQQNTQRVPAGVLSLRIGQPVSGATGQSRPGDIWVPAPGQENWQVAVYPGYVAGTTTLPPGTVTAPFNPVVPSVGPCFPDDLTNAEFLPDPLSQTGDRCIYAATNSSWVWKYYKLRVTLPTIAKDPWFWHCFVSVQKGHKTTGTCAITGGTTLTRTTGADFTAAMVGWALHVGTATERTIAAFTSANQVTLNAPVPNGTGQSFELWNHAPDSEGIDEHPTLYLGRWHRSSPQAPFGISSDAVATVDFPSENIDFTYPLAKNPDQSTNLDRDFRFRLYAVSHANDNVPSTGAPAVPFSYQVIAFKGADHFDLTPALMPAIHDATQINDKTLGAGLKGGSGLLPFVNADPLSPLYADLAGLHFRAGADYVVVENPPGSGHYELSQAIVDLAKAVNFDTINFKKQGGAFLVNNIAVNNLIAGDALFAGQATFAYKLGTVEGGKVTISSGGLTIASTITNPVATLALSSTGLSFVRDIFTGTTLIGRNRLDLTASGITVQSQNASFAPTAQIVINTGPPASIQIITNGQSIGLTSAGITIADSLGGRVDMDTTNGVRLSKGGNITQVLANGIKLTDNFGGTLTMDNTDGIKLSRGGSITQIQAAGITLTDSSGGTVQMNASGVKVSRGTFSVLVAAAAVTIATGTGGQQMVLDASSVTIQTNFNSYGAIVIKATSAVNSISINSSASSTLGNWSIECTGTQQMLMGPTSNPGILKIETGVAQAKVTLDGTVVLDRAQVLGHHVPRYSTAGIPVMDDGEMQFRFDGSFMQMLFRKGSQVYYWVEAGHVAYPFLGD